MLLALWEIAELTKGRLLSGNTSRGAAWTAGPDSGDSFSWKSSEQGVLLPGFWASCGSGLGDRGMKQRVGSGGRTGSGQSRASLHAACSLASGRAVWRSSHLYFCSSADGVLPAEAPHRGALSRNANSPAVTCRGPRSSSQLSLEVSWTKKQGPEGLKGACTSSWRRAGRQDGPQRCGCLLDDHRGGGAGVRTAWLG